MQQNDDNTYPSDSIPAEASDSDSICMNKTSIIKPVHCPNQLIASKHAEFEEGNEDFSNRIATSSSQVLCHSSNLREHAHKIQLSEENAYTTQEYLITNCWDSNKVDAPIKLVELFKECNDKEEDLDFPVTKVRLEEDSGNDMSPPYTREYHMLTEVQKSRILTAVEDAIKNLAQDECCKGLVKEEQMISPSGNDHVNAERIIGKKFLLPWVLVKVSELVLCHIIQLTFLSDRAYFKKENDFLPIVVTYYLTLFVIVLSLLVHISCFSYANVRNPCYFMGVISSSLLTLTLTMGILIMLSTMNYYKTYRQTLVLIFVSFLAFLLFVELYLFYVEVKNIWSTTEQIDQNYIT